MKELLTVNLYLFDLTKYSSLLEDKELYSTLEEREISAKYDKIRADYKLISYMLRRIVLSSLEDCSPLSLSYSYEEHGKPFLQKSKLNFNVSHSQNWFLLGVVMDSSIGVDLEIVQQVQLHLSFINSFISEEEQRCMFCDTENYNLETVYKYWCLKESVCKATGLGLIENLQDISFETLQDRINLSTLKPKYRNHKMGNAFSSFCLKKEALNLGIAVTVINNNISEFNNYEFNSKGNPNLNEFKRYK